MAIDYKLVARQRAARLAEEAAQKVTPKVSRPNFWDNINTSGGLDACHPWEGQTRFNHPPTARARYEEGIFEGYEGADTRYAQRVLCLATYGRPVPKDMDVSPICGDHLCMNLRHLAIVKHGGSGAARDNTAVPVAEFFCERAA